MNIRLLKLFVIAIFLIYVTGKANSQTVFVDNFGQHITRVTTPFMPGSSYKFADPTAIADAANSKEIENNYYAVIDPTHIRDEWPIPAWWFWTGPEPVGNTWGGAGNTTVVTDHTGDTNGAVLVINAGTTLQSFYERPVTLQKGANYRISFWAYVVNASSQIGVKIKSAVSKAVVGSTSTASISSHGWIQYTFDFTVPVGPTCTGDFYISLENILSNNSGNDYYVDDVKLEKVVTASSPFSVSCSTESFASKYKNTVTVTANETDPDDTNNTSSVVPKPTKITSFTYGTYCKSESNPLPSMAANGVKGVFTASPSGLTINSSTGEISLSTSTAGTYTVTNTVDATDIYSVSMSTATVTVSASPSAPTVSSSTPTNSCPALTVNLSTLITSTTPSGGSVLFKTTNNPTGTDVPTPTAVGAGTYYIFYSNSTGCYSTGTSVTVSISNCPPTVTAISKTGSEDSDITFVAADFSGKFSDPNSDALTKIKVIDLPANGTLKLNGTAISAGAEILAADLAKITFTPGANWNGSTSFNWNGNDGTAYAASNAAVNITITAVNDAPVAVNDSYTVAEDGTVTLLPLTGDTDVDGNTLSITSINGTTLSPGTAQAITVSHGTVNITAGGVITFTPDANFNSATAVSIPYVITDGTTTATANELITVTAVNDAPVAVNDTYTVAEDGTVTLLPLTADTDVDGNTLSITSINGTTLTPGTAQAITVSHGTVNITAGGVITFTPDANFNSATAVSIPYVITDGTTTATANELITVTAVNDAPVAVNDTYTVAEDGTVTLLPLTADTDVDGNTLSITSINGTTLTPGTAQAITVSHGTVNITAGGVITFTPDANFNSATAVSIAYVITDGTTTATANELITVTAVNDAPVVSAISKSGTEDTDITFIATDFTSKFSDADGNSLTKIKVIDLPANGTLKLNGTAITGGDEIQAADLSKITFTPGANWNGSTSFNWNGNDGTVYAASNAAVNITITAVNDAPVAVNDTYTVAEDGTVTLLPLTADTDVDGNTLSITSINGTTLTPGTAQAITVSHGTVNITAGGVITFTPDANFNSATAVSIPYVITDGTTTATANELITVTAVNDAPVAVNDTYTVAEDGTVTLLPLTADTDVDGNTLSITSINGTTLTPGTAQAITVSHGTVNITAGGVITFTPDANFNSATAVSIPYVITDGTTTATANELITVTAVNDAPVAVNDSYTVAEDGTVTLLPLTADIDVDGNTLSITSINGTTLTPGTAQAITVSHGTVNITAGGVITFTPDANFNSATAVSIPYVITDGTTTATANELITVTAVNDAPVVSAISKSGPEDTDITFIATDFTSKFSDADGNSLTKIKVIDLPANGTLKLNGTAITAGDEILAADLAKITFTPSTNWNGSTSFNWNGNDGTVYAASNAAVNITITAVNDAPVVSAISKSGPEDTDITFTAVDFTSKFSDADGNSLTKIKVVDLPANGTLKLNGTAITAGDEILAADLAKITFTPSTNWNGSTSFNWNGNDGTVYAASNAAVNITITAVNDAPVAVNDTYTVAEDGTVTLLPLTDDTDVDGNTLSITSINGTTLTPGTAQAITVSNGTVNITAGGVITFTPDANFNSATAVSIPYVITDGTTTATANELITVTAVNDAPVAVNDNYTVAEDGTVTLLPLTDDTDVDGNTLSIVSINGTTLTPGTAQAITVSNGTVNITAGGEIAFTPDANFNSATALSIPYVITRWNNYSHRQ